MNKDHAVRRIAAALVAAGTLGAAGIGGIAAAPAAHAASPSQTIALSTGALIGKGPKIAASAAVAAAAPTPSSVDLRQWAVPVGDQSGVNSCTTWAVDYALLGWYSRRDGKAGQPFAPMYTYSQLTHGVDTGLYAEDVLKSAVSRGSDTRADYTQGDYDFVDQPTASENAVAGHYKITGYHTLFANSTNQGSSATTAIRQALAAGHPVSVGFKVRSGFYSLLGNPDPNAIDDDVTSDKTGSHEVLAVGYDSAGVIIQNSWGTGFGNGGFGRLSWRVVNTDFYEAFTIDGFANPGGNWDIGGSITSKPSVATPTPTHQDVYYRGPNNHLFVSSHDNGGWWSAPVDLGGVSLTSEPSAVTPTATHTDVYYRGPNNHLFVSSHDNGAFWSAPVDLGGANLASGPSAVTPTATHTDVYYRGPNNHLFVSSHDNGGWWSAPTDMGGVSLTSEPSAVTPTATHTDVYYHGPSNHLFVSSHDNGGWWSAPTDLGGNLTTGPGVAQPGAVSASNPQSPMIEVYSGGASSHLFVTPHLTGSAWSPPEDLNGALASSPAAVRITGTVTVFYQGTNGHLWVANW